MEAPPSILDLKTSEYVFGRLVSRKALAVQITISNSSHDYNLLVSQISLSFCEGADDKNQAAPATPDQGKAPAGTPAPAGPAGAAATCTAPLSLSSMDKIVLQGLADRGQSTDPRNVVLRIIEGVGAALVPFPTFVHHIGSSFTPSVAAWNGPFTQGYKIVFPDYTVNQIIRLSNLAFTTNKVIGKQTSETVVAFIPLEVVFSKQEVSTFHTDPHRQFVDLARRSIVRVDATFITPVKPTPAKVASVFFNLAAQRVEVTGDGFDDSAKVILNGKALPTAFWNKGSLWGMFGPGLAVKNGDSDSIKVQMGDGSSVLD